MSFFVSKIKELNGVKVSFSNAKFQASDRKFADYIEFCRKQIKSISADGQIECKTIEFVLGFSDALKEKIGKYCKFVQNKEAYVIELGETTVITAETEEGFIFAISNLLELIECGENTEGFIYDYPLSEVRGYKLFLPGRDQFESFKAIVDFLANYRFNCIMFEIGGAMEYKRHPEINEFWVKMCEDINEYSGKGLDVKRRYPWPHNCFHCQNGGGSFLTQDEVKELVAYCNSRGLEVIPECPLLSHCDYLVGAHPEIAELNPEEFPDPYPESYCPNNPKSYELAFDILEEVIEVFNPKSINIGHDEAFNLGVCPRCKDTPAHELYANDIWKLRDFLKERNINVLMWGEKLLKSYVGKYPVGGTGLKGSIPKLWPCRYILPRDVTMLNWYYGLETNIGLNQDLIYKQNGYDVIYGNLSANGVRCWNKRRERYCGGIVSNWGSCEEIYMQRNIQYLSLIITAYAFWCDDYEALDKEKANEMFMKELYALKQKKVKNPIKITHSTDHRMKYKAFVDGYFVTDEEYFLGNYELEYKDGSKAKLPVYYGTHITVDNYADYLIDALYIEVGYTTLPKKFGDKFVYEAVYENPNPDSEIVNIKYVPVESKKDIKVDFYGLGDIENLEDLVSSERIDVATESDVNSGVNFYIS